MLQSTMSLVSRSNAHGTCIDFGMSQPIEVPVAPVTSSLHQCQAVRLMANGSRLHSLPCMLQMAAAFALGASGVVLGTRLCATHESLLPEAKKQALVEAGYSSSCNPSTLRTTLYDELGTVPWPPQIDGRCLTNQFTAVYSGQTPLQVGSVLASSFCQHICGVYQAVQGWPAAGICIKQGVNHMMQQTTDLGCSVSMFHCMPHWY